MTNNFIFFNLYQIIIEIIDCNDDENNISNIDICKKKYMKIFFLNLYSYKIKIRTFSIIGLPNFL